MTDRDSAISAYCNMTWLLINCNCSSQGSIYTYILHFKDLQFFVCVFIFNLLVTFEFPESCRNLIYNHLRHDLQVVKYLLINLYI